jgi:uncharacterized membrane protein YdbT with pleckstrin-like domain
METEYSENPAMFKNNPIGFIVALALIPAFGLGLVILIYWFLSVKASKLEIKGNDILFEQGLMSKDRSELNIDRVTNVKIKQSFFNRIFGVGSVELYTSGDVPEIATAGMPDPNRIREIIKKHQNK